MEVLFLLLGGTMLAIPVMAIAALVRTGRFRKTLEDQYLENLRSVSDLKREIADLRRALADVSLRVDRQGGELLDATKAAAPAVPAAAESVPTKDERSEQIPAAQVSGQVASPPLAEIIAQSRNPRRQHYPAAPTARDADLATISAASASLTGDSIVAFPTPSTVHSKAAETPATPPPASAPTVQPFGTMGQQQPGSVPNFAVHHNVPHRRGFAEQLRATLPLEEVLGMNLFAKIGIVLLVLGFALLGRVALIAMGPGGKIALLYAAAATLLGGGIWLERKERYRLIGRAGIGGGWALLFFTTYAMHHVSAMHVMNSETLNCVLLLGVAAAMVAHTLRYQSQLVTGLAFLLAFSTVALSQDTVYALAAGVILAIGIVAIALRMGWYELEVFGILASYGNHFYWLYKMYPDGVAGHPFPQFWPSAVILVLYWLIFRISYVARGIRTSRDELVSTIAALANPVLLLAVMKFQSTRPELAFYALLALGALEFLFGQLPATRRRRPAFILLTVLGTLLMLASVPFKFSGNNIALLWMIGAEALLIAGIAQAEVVFRRLGLFTGISTGLLIAFEARHIVELRQHSELPLVQDGVLLLACGALFYLNGLFIRHKWRHLFASLDEHLMTTQSYIGCVTAFLGIWGLFTQQWTAIGWSALMLLAAIGTRRLGNKHLLAQAWGLASAVGIRALLVNAHLGEPYPHHLASRLITLPVLALVFYLTSAALSVSDLRVSLRTLSLWAGSSLLVLLAWLEVMPAWVSVVWVAFVLVLTYLARRTSLKELFYQEHVLALLVAAQLVYVNLGAQRTIQRYLPIFMCAAMMYAISRLCTLQAASYRRYAAWAHTWVGTALLAALAWHESPLVWLAAILAVFALALAIADRLFDVEEFPYQAHTLAALAVLGAAKLNVYTLDKWHGIDLRLITLSIIVAVMYALARWVRIPQTLRQLDVHHAYSWVGSLLAAWMLWGELQPVGVALGLAILGLLLFEWGMLQHQRQLRFQAYATLTAAFVRIFFINLTATTLPGEALSSRVVTVAPIALICFFVWARLQSRTEKLDGERGSAGSALAYFGTGCIAALLYFQIAPEWIIVSWAVMVLTLMVATLVWGKEVFLQQAVILVVGTVARGLAHNLFGGSYFTAGGWRGSFSVLLLTAFILFAALPVAFRLRRRYAVRPMDSRLSRYLLLNRPEQLLFFAPVLLVTVMIAVKMNPGMVTLSWGVEGVLVILLGLIVSQRSYRITGLLLLLLCVGKIVFRDAWQLSERDRYITFIVLGTALTLVSTLYSKYRESMRRLL